MKRTKLCMVKLEVMGLGHPQCKDKGTQASLENRRRVREDGLAEQPFRSQSSDST